MSSGFVLALVRARLRLAKSIEQASVTMDRRMPIHKLPGPAIAALTATLCYAPYEYQRTKETGKSLMDLYTAE